MLILLHIWHFIWQYQKSNTRVLKITKSSFCLSQDSKKSNAVHFRFHSDSPAHARRSVKLPGKPLTNCPLAPRPLHLKIFHFHFHFQLSVSTSPPPSKDLSLSLSNCPLAPRLLHLKIWSSIWKWIWLHSFTFPLQSLIKVPVPVLVSKPLFTVCVFTNLLPF